LKDSNVTSDCSKRTKPETVLFGVGINDADYNVTIGHRENGKKVFDWICPIYTTWLAMLRRCYSKTAKARHESYTCETVHPDWLRFSGFRVWMVEQDWEGKVLDKDFLSGGSLAYGPDTCVFVPQWLNTTIARRSDSQKGDYLPGVYWHKRIGKFKASVSLGMGRKAKHLGYFENEVDAHLVWRDAKAEVYREIIETQTDQRIIAVLEQKVLDLYNELGEDNYIERFNKNQHLLKRYTGETY